MMSDENEFKLPSKDMLDKLTKISIHMHEALALIKDSPDSASVIQANIKAQELVHWAQSALFAKNQQEPPKEYPH